MTEKSLTGKTAIVTGASRGIGLAIVHRLAEEGATVYAGIRHTSTESQRAFDEIQEECGVEIHACRVDLSNAETAMECARELAKIEHIHVLVNNAGVASGSPFQMTPLAEFRSTFEVNFFSTAVLSQLVSRRMARMAGSSIVNIASTAGMNGDAGTAAYGSSKAALIYLTQVMARELGRSGIRVNAVAPTVTETDMYLEMAEEARIALVEGGALKRPASPRDIANVVAFLSSDDAAMITGQVIRVDGGQRGR
jgi:3-oxoacyl-[acyl-carrier protein] reductase